MGGERALERMNTRTKYWGILVVLGLVLVLTGCDPNMTTSPILPGQTAVLSITFEPNPVYEGYSNTYSFLVYIDEVNSVGADIESIKIEYINNNGEVWKTETWGYYDVVRAFGTNRIEALGRLMTYVRVDDCFFCDRLNWLVRADDDYGTHVEYSGVIQFISR